MGVYARATDSGKRDAINALPFAKASPPDHVLSLHPEVGAQNRAQLSESPIKTLKNKGKLA